MYLPPLKHFLEKSLPHIQSTQKGGDISVVSDDSHHKAIRGILFSHYISQYTLILYV